MVEGDAAARVGDPLEPLEKAAAVKAKLDIPDVPIRITALAGTNEVPPASTKDTKTEEDDEVAIAELNEVHIALLTRIREAREKTSDI